MTTPRVILASTSRYRRDQIAQLGFPFDQRNPGLDEDQYKQIIDDPKELALVLAKAKAEAAANDVKRELQTQPDDTPFLIIAGDQVAAIEGKLLSKPGSLEGAVAQLQKLTGRTHYLHSAVALYESATDTIHSHVSTHAMTMRALSEAQLRRYATRDEPFDCAGSYRVEALGISLFSSIAGDDHSAIVGLPLMSLTQMLDDCGLELP